jgi:hypothetical protein
MRSGRPRRRIGFLALLAVAACAWAGCVEERGAREVQVSKPSPERSEGEARAATKPPPAIATH